MRRLAVTLALAVALAGLAFSQDAQKPLAPGDAAADFVVKDQTGAEVKLADLKGKRFVLWFFPKADTGG